MNSVLLATLHTIMSPASLSCPYSVSGCVRSITSSRDKSMRALAVLIALGIVQDSLSLSLSLVSSSVSDGE